jgi:hypothetical protein
MNKAFRIIPIFFFILLALFWIAESYLSLGVIHYPACTVVILLIIQLIYNNRFTGLLYSIVLLMFSGYMLVSSIIDHFSTALPTEVLSVSCLLNLLFSALLCFWRVQCYITILKCLSLASLNFTAPIVI